MLQNDFEPTRDSATGLPSQYSPGTHFNIGRGGALKSTWNR